jgi:hypothetical protein
MLTLKCEILTQSAELICYTFMAKWQPYNIPTFQPYNILEYLKIFVVTLENCNANFEM